MGKVILLDISSWQGPSTIRLNVMLIVWPGPLANITITPPRARVPSQIQVMEASFRLAVSLLPRMDPPQIQVTKIVKFVRLERTFNIQ